MSVVVAMEEALSYVLLKAHRRCVIFAVYFLTAMVKYPTKQLKKEGHVLVGSLSV